MYKVIIFDFNGTLIDDCDLCLQIFNQLCHENHLKKISKRKYKEIFTFPVSVYYQKAGFNIDGEEFKNIGNRFHQLYNQLSNEQVKLFKNVKKVLEKLKKDYTLVCLSASMQQTLENQLKFYQINQYFDYIIGLSNNQAVSKLDAAKTFIRKKQWNGNEILFVGDSIHDLEVAKAISSKCLLVSTGHTSEKRLEETGNKVIKDLIEIVNFL